MKNFKKWIGFVLVISLILSLMPWKQGDDPISRAEEHVISNPSVEDGVSTWDCIYFGYYFQNDDSVKDAIKWRVLSVNDNDAFLLADKNLDCQPYTKERIEFTILTWETCTLRNWLNENFYNIAFPTEAQKNAIKITKIINENNPIFGTFSGEITYDKIYVPSVSEMENNTYGFTTEHLKTNTRISNSSEYALSVSSTFEHTDRNEYWLRTFGNSSSVSCTVIGSSGFIDLVGVSVTPITLNIYVRPCLHLDLSSSEWSYAGTVSSNGEENALPSPTPIATATPFPTPSPTPVPTPTPTAKPTATPPVSSTQTPDTADNSSPAPTDGNDKQPAVSTPPKTVSAPGRPTKLAVKNNKKKTVTVSWKKVKGASGYQVQYAVNTVFSKKTAKTTKKTKLSIKKLKKKKTYCFRVRAYKTNNGVKKYGKWSKVKKVKIKK